MLPSEAWRDLVGAGVPMTYRPGTVLLHQGDPGSHVLILLSGRVKALRDEADGGQLLLAVRGPGEVLGEMAVLDGTTRSATIIAIDRCAVRALPGPDFMARIRHHDLLGHVIHHVLSRLRENEELRAELARLPTARRLARTLLRLNELLTTQAGRPAGLALAQEELARAIGVSRSAVAAELRVWRQAGLIGTARRQVTVRDVEALRRIANGSDDVSTSGQY